MTFLSLRVLDFLKEMLSFAKKKVLSDFYFCFLHLYAFKRNRAQTTFSLLLKKIKKKENLFFFFLKHLLRKTAIKCKAFFKKKNNMKMAF